MAAVAAGQHSRWAPQDDLLLKNALEAGASLESLAKGAAQFSQRFTIRELQNRWHSLLYDDSVASEVADHILFLESSASNLSKDDKSSSLGGMKCVNRKRNGESVRRNYYCLTKRTCKEPVNFVCQDSLLDSSSRNTGHIENFCEKFIAGLTNDACILKSSTDSPFEIPGPICIQIDQEFISGCSALLEDKLPVETIDQEHLNDYGSNAHTDDIPHVFEDNLLDFYNGSHDLVEDPTNQLTACESFLRADALHYKTPASFCSKDIHQFVLSSSLPNLEICKTIEATCEPVTPVDYHFGVKENGLLPDVNGKKLTSEHDLQSETNGKDYQLALSEKGIMEGSSTLLEISSEEENFDMDIDSLNSDLLKPLVVSDAKWLLAAGSSVVEEDIFRGHLDMAETCLQIASDDDLDFLPLQCIKVPIVSHEITYKYEEHLFCSLNAEDSDIPDNSDLFPMIELLSFPDESADSSFLWTDTFTERQNSDEKLILLLEGISPLVHEMGGFTSEGCVEVFSPHTSGYERKSGIVEIASLLPAIQDPYTRTSEFSVITDASFNGYDDDVHTIVGVESSRDICLNPLYSGLSRCYSQCRQEPDDTSPKINISSSKYDHQNEENRFMEASYSASNNGESTYESDSDVPCFSNIETMILDMDLGPSDEESCFSREVSRFEYKDSKKTIIRLEQGAISFIQRAIALHGAMAVFYGRQMKYYIKKTEVLIGRATDDINVDIDLKKEGRASKVSRRQAIIKMEDGLFCLTNLGKHVISVNSRDVPCGHCTNLSSSSLIEIVGMEFMFEMNPHFNKQPAVSNIALRKFNRGQLANFEFPTDDN